MAPAPGKVRAGSWDQTDILLGEIARGKNIIVGANHQRRHRDAVELRAPVESQDGVEPTRLNVRLVPVEWTGLYFGANAGYGWAKGSSHTIFTDNARGIWRTHDNGTGSWRNRAEGYGRVGLRQPNRRHCWRSNRF